MRWKLSFAGRYAVLVAPPFLLQVWPDFTYMPNTAGSVHFRTQQSASLDVRLEFGGEKK